MNNDILNNITNSNNIEKININNIDITINKTTKYTNVLFNIYFLTNYNSNWPYLQFISEMLSKSNNVNKTMEEQFQYLYGLYGTGLYVGKFSNYKTMGLKVTLDVINQKIVNENKLYDECFDAMKTMLFDPHVFANKDGEIEFDKKDLNEVKNNVINELINESNDKRRYANYRFLKKMSRNDEFPLVLKQTISQIKSIKGTDVYKFYKELLNDSKIVISVIGDIDKEDIESMIKKLDFKSNNIDLEFEDSNIFVNDIKSKRYTEIANIKQAHINMGYRTDILYRHELYPAYLLFNIMFGELPSSTLFSTIREEQGLAYSVYSSVFPIRNALFIYAGVDNEKINLAIKSIKKQLTNYQTGEILKNKEHYKTLLLAAKNELRNEYINSLDNQTDVLAQNLRSAIVNRRSLKELYEDSISVTLEDVVIASKHLVLDTIYVLKGGNK